MYNGKVYLAGPIFGLDYEGATSWREEATNLLSDYGILALSPMRAKEHLKDEKHINHFYNGVEPMSTSKGIVTRDRNDVRTCDIVIAYLKGAERASMGTCIEFGWADAWRKPVIMVAAPGDLHEEHGIMTEIAGYKVEEVSEAVEIAAALLGAEYLPAF